LVILFLAFALERLTNSIADPDIWGYMAFGRYFWESGSFPYQDVFSYTPTLKPWVYHEWLTGVLLYKIYHIFGPPGLQILKYVTALLTVWIMYLTVRKRGGDYLGVFVVLFVIQGFLVLGYSPVRAQIFTWAFFALTLYLLENARIKEKYGGLWLLLPIQVVWCNLHGGFLSGLGLIGIYALGESIKRRSVQPYLFILLFAGLATLINPYGWVYWKYLITAITMPRPEINEWVSVIGAFQRGVFKSELIYIASVILFSFLFLLWTPKKEFTPILALGFTLFLGLRHIRHIVFFLILIGAYLPSSLSILFERFRNDPKISPLIDHLGLKILTILLLILLPYFSIIIAKQDPLSLRVPEKIEPNSKSNIYYPVGAINFIKEKGIKGDILGEFDWGEYLIWSLYPQCLVSLDGRYETVYPAGLCKEYFNFIYGRDTWRTFLEKYPPQMILIRSNSKIYFLLSSEPDWRLIYIDSGSALFIKNGVTI